jgi:hypothetical protein
MISGQAEILAQPLRAFRISVEPVESDCTKIFMLDNIQMGTRHLIFVFYQGRYRIAQYGQFDGYVDEQGLKILAFLSEPHNISRLRQALEADLVHEVSEKEIKCYEKELEDWKSIVRRELRKHQFGCHVWSNLHAIQLNLPMYSESPLSVFTSSDILHMVVKASKDKPIGVKLDLESLGDWISIEYIYVIDSDKEQFEVYSGFVSLEEDCHVGRFDDLEVIKQSGWAPRLLRRYEFQHLPTWTQFLSDCASKEQEDDDDDDDDDEDCGNELEGRNNENDSDSRHDIVSY